MYMSIGLYSMLDRVYALSDRDQPGSGKFIYLNPANLAVSSIARLSTTQSLPAGFDVCFVRFFYQAQGDKAGSLYLYTQSVSSKLLTFSYDKKYEISILGW